MPYKTTTYSNFIEFKILEFVLPFVSRTFSEIDLYSTCHKTAKALNYITLILPIIYHKFTTNSNE